MLSTQKGSPACLHPLLLLLVLVPETQLLILIEGFVQSSGKHDQESNPS